MKVKVAKWGNSVAVRLPKAAAEALQAVPGSELELTVVNGKAELSSPSRVRRINLDDLVAEARRLGPDHIPPFEDWSAVEAPWPDEDWSDIAPRDDAPVQGAPDLKNKTKNEGRRGSKRS